MAYSQDDLNRLQKYLELQRQTGENLTNYAEMYKTINELKRTSKHLDDEALKTKDKIKKVNKELQDLNLKRNTLSQKDYDTEKARLQGEKKRLKNNYQLAKKNSEEAKILGKHLAENLNINNMAKATLGSTLGIMKDITKTIISQKGYLFEQQKSVKMTELQMGILNKQSRGFRDNIYNSALHTNQLGVDVKGLSEMQATYSSEVGRTVELTEAGLQAMSELATGTILGQENAARFAANMENFGHSVEASRDFMEETLNLSHQMGLNSSKVTQKLEQSLRLAQRYNFRKGVEGAKDMAFYATKFKMEIESIAGMAEKVFNPEGAIEMASQLSVLGGAWGQLGDPFSLMFKARNDIEGFTKDIMKAAEGTANFNRATGEVDIESMELHRLREVAKVTGIGLDELTKSAREAAKFSAIKMDISGNFDDDVIDFITAKSRWDDKTNQFKVNISGSDYFVNELHKFGKGELSRLAKQRQSLKENALQAKNFDEQWDNLVNQFKTTLLPGFGRFTDAMVNGLVEFQDWMKDNEVLENLADLGKQVGAFGAAVVKFIAKNPIISGVMALLSKPAMWIARGRLLGVGFNMTASGGMMGKATGSGIGQRVLGNATGGGKFGKGARMVGRAGGAMALAGAGVDAFQNFSDDSLSGWEAAGKTLDENKFAAIGAVVGSIVPVLGTLAGAGIGALVDRLVVPALSQDGNRTSITDNWGQENQDFVSRPGEKPIPFSSADTLIGMKKGGGIDNFLSKKKNTPSGKMEVSFKPLKIDGSIDLRSNGSSASIDLNNPILVREITRLVQEQLSTALNGKLTQSPI
jgi:hypothetical protein